MDLREAETLARKTIKKHGLSSWTFKFDNAKKRFGLCNYTRKTISLSRHLVKINDRDRVLMTILHEIAHALAGSAAKHGPVWRRICISIGGDGKRCYTEENTTVPKDHKFEIHCTCCNDTIARRHRAPKADRIKNSYCRACGIKSKGKLVLHRN